MRGAGSSEIIQEILSLLYIGCYTYAFPRPTVSRTYSVYIYGLQYIGTTTVSGGFFLLLPNIVGRVVVRDTVRVSSRNYCKAISSRDRVILEVGTNNKPQS